MDRQLDVTRAVDAHRWLRRRWRDEPAIGELIAQLVSIDDDRWRQDIDGAQRAVVALPHIRSRAQNGMKAARGRERRAEWHRFEQTARQRDRVDRAQLQRRVTQQTGVDGARSSSAKSELEVAHRGIRAARTVLSRLGCHIRLTSSRSYTHMVQSHGAAHRARMSGIGRTLPPRAPVPGTSRAWEVLLAFVYVDTICKGQGDRDACNAHIRLSTRSVTQLGSALTSLTVPFCRRQSRSVLQAHLVASPNFSRRFGLQSAVEDMLGEDVRIGARGPEHGVSTMSARCELSARAF